MPALRITFLGRGVSGGALIPYLLVALAFQANASPSLTLIDRYPGSAFAVSNSGTGVAIIRGTTACVYPYAGAAPWGNEGKFCFSFPHALNSVEWAPDGSAISIAGPTGSDGSDDALWIIDLRQGTTSKVSADIDALAITYHAWLDNHLIVGHSCGGSCVAFRLVGSRDMTLGDVDCKMGMEGRLHAIAEQGHVVGMGHAGELVEIRPGKDDTGLRLSCRTVYEGCLSESTWFRFEDSIDKTKSMMSIQPCRSGALHEIGSGSVLHNEATGTVDQSPFGSPASTSPRGDLVASLIKTSASVFLSINRIADYESILQVELRDYRNISPINDFDWQALLPKWAVEGQYVSVATVAARQGLRYLRLELISLKDKSIEPILTSLHGIEDYNWLAHNRLVVRTRQGVSVYQITEGPLGAEK